MPSAAQMKGPLARYYELQKGSWVIKFFSALCAFMTFWCWIFPGSFRAGPKEDAHARLMAELGAMGPGAPSAIFTAFRHHLSVRVLHNAMAGVWCLCALNNLQPWFSKFSPVCHRGSGYLFFAASASLALSYVLMEVYGLTHSPHGGTWSLGVVALWFVYSGGRALGAARRHQWALHRAWVMRHLAAGLWVVLQRLLIGVYTTALMARWRTLPQNLPRRSEEEKVEVFVIAAGLAMLIVAAMAEHEARRQGAKAKA